MKSLIEKFKELDMIWWVGGWVGILQVDGWVDWDGWMGGWIGMDGWIIGY